MQRVKDRHSSPILLPATNCASGWKTETARGTAGARIEKHAVLAPNVMGMPVTSCLGRRGRLLLGARAVGRHWAGAVGPRGTGGMNDK